MSLLVLLSFGIEIAKAVCFRLWFLYQKGSLCEGDENPLWHLGRIHTGTLKEPPRVLKEKELFVKVFFSHWKNLVP